MVKTNKVMIVDNMVYIVEEHLELGIGSIQVVELWLIYIVCGF